MIQDTSGDVIFNVQFKAIACKPEKNEVLDGKVTEVVSTGIQVQSGPIKTFITIRVINSTITKLIFYRKTDLSINTTRQVTNGSKRTNSWTKSLRRVFMSDTGSQLSNTSTMIL